MTAAVRLVGMGVALAGLVACTGGDSGKPGLQGAPTSGASATAAAPASPSPSAPSPEPWNSPDQFHAVWPETAPSEVPEELPEWRESARETVRRFAVSVLEWPAPVIESVEPDPGTGGHGEVFTVARVRGSNEIEVHARRVIGPGHWSVAYLWGFGEDDHGASVSISEERGASVTFHYWNGAASADLLIRYGEHRIERTSTQEASWEAPVTFPLDVPGAVMVLFRDASGHVFSGWATALPAGSFAAS